MTTKIANKDARAYVAKRVDFKGSNVFAETNVRDGYTVYTVYSYGYHFPLYIAVTDPDTHVITWFENCDRYYSASTARHFSQCNPYTLCIPMDTKKMLAIARFGVAGMLEVHA